MAENPGKPAASGIEMASPRPGRVRSSRAAQKRQALVLVMLIGCALISLSTTLGTVVMLAYESANFFLSEEIEIGKFLSGTRWTIGQTQGEIHYGIWPLISGTFRIAIIALLFALPTGILAAIYLSEYAPRVVRSILKPVLEILAGIPTVVLGFFAVTFITPYILGPIGEFKPFNAASAGLAVGILCLPLITSLVEDALQSVPQSLREAAYGLGSTKFETTVKVVVPAAISGIVSAILLALARAVGETMVVALAAGSTATFTLDPRQPSQTMAGFIVETLNSESVVPGTLSYYSIYAVALVLFLLTMICTIVGEHVRKRYREVYA
jgi:phosphate transport system permease protein